MVLVALGGAYYLGTMKKVPTPTPPSSPTASSTPNTSDETKNWKTYTNNRYKFSFKYPASLTVRTDSNDNFIGFLENPKENSTQALWISINENGNNLDLKDFDKKEREEIIPNGSPDYTTKEKAINGNQFLIVHNCPNCQSGIATESYAYRVKIDGVVVSFLADYMNHANGITITKSLSEEKELLEKVASTFRFK